MNIKFLSENNVARKGFFLVFLVFSLLVVSVFSVFAQTTTSATSGTSFPVNPPAGEVTGGYFQRYFDNIFNTGTLCPTGQALVGFRYESGTPLYNNDATGTPVCRPIGAADGLASGFTGALKGEDNRIPMYSNGGTTLTGSILRQKIIRNNTAMESDGDFYVGKYSGYANNLIEGPESFGAKLYFEGVDKHNDEIYLQRIFRGQDVNELRLMLGDNAGQNYTPNLQDRFVIGGTEYSTTPSRWLPQFTFLSNGRFGIKNSNPTTELDIAGKIKITDGSQGTGKILTSDGAGIATWKDIPHSLPLDCAVPGKNKNHTCFGKDALGRASETFNDTAFGYAAGRHLKGNSNVFMGHVAFGNGYTATGNVVIGAEAANTFVDHLKENVIIGYRSFERFEKGENNVMIGAHAGRNPTGFAGAKMNNSIIIGGGVTHH